MPLGLDALILAVLSIPIPLKYRVLPIDGTPYWLFSLLFILLGLFVSVSLFPGIFKKAGRSTKVRAMLFWTILFIVVGCPMVTAIVDRSKTAPVYGVHDIILQQEAAMRYLIVGKNPYKETYFGTPLESWHYDELGKQAINPALYHFVMPPWYLLFPFVFYAFSIPILGYFDGRMVLLFCLFGIVFFLLRWFKDKQYGYLAASLIALTPGVIDYFIEGRSDIFALFWFIWAMYLLEKRQWIMSAIVFGLALISKQTIWFAFPLYGAYIWAIKRKDLAQTIKLLGISVLASGGIMLPFLLWDGRAFLESVVLYLSGGGAHGYPVSGYGLGMLLHELGVVADIHGYYPFILWQLALGLPVLVWCVWKLVQRPTMSRLLLGYALFLVVVWYASRYFNNSHLGYIGSILSLGVLKHWDEGTHEV